MIVAAVLIATLALLVLLVAAVGVGDDMWGDDE